MQNKPRIIRRW